MCSRHVEPGAGEDFAEREYRDRRDDTCDYCGRERPNLRQINLGHSVSWLCQPCYDKQQEQYRAMTGEAA